jgi:two-component system, cell cycle response regulator DivK
MGFSQDVNMANTIQHEAAAKKTVLIVEDNFLNLKLMRDLLEASGIATLQAEDGTQALEVALEHQPDVVLMDIQLPGMSGLIVTRQFKTDADLQNIPIIAVTALASREDKEEALEAGCDAYISKPFAAEQFLGLVKKALG